MSKTPTVGYEMIGTFAVVLTQCVGFPRQLMASSDALTPLQHSRNQNTRRCTQQLLKQVEIHNNETTTSLLVILSLRGMSTRRRSYSRLPPHSQRRCASQTVGTSVLRHHSRLPLFIRRGDLSHSKAHFKPIKQLQSQWQLDCCPTQSQLSSS